MIRFGEFLPDQSDFNNSGVTSANNVIPSLDGYSPFNDLASISDAADGDIVGMFAASNDDGTDTIYVADRAKLYKYVPSTKALTNVSKSGNYTTASTDVTNFVQFGETVVATNFTDPIQKITASAAGLFSDLSADAPKAKYIAVVRDFVMTAFTSDSSDGVKPYRARWSGIGDATSWAVSATTQADFQDIMDMGSITGLVGGEYATILMEKGIVRASYIGSPLVFQFDNVETRRGCKVPGSVANVGHFVFYLSDDGFYMFDGQASKAIGAEKVDRFFYNDFNSAYPQNVSASADPKNQIIIWSYPSTNSSDGSADKLIIYNYVLDRWSTAEANVTALSPLYSATYTLEGLDNINSSLDALPASLDSPSFIGGQFIFAAAKDKKIQTFTGDTLAAIIETGEFEVKKGSVSLVRNIIPYVTTGSDSTGTVTAQIASRTRQVDSSSFGSSSSLNADNFIPVRSNGRYHKVRVNLSGDWSRAQGIDIDATALGRR